MKRDERIGGEWHYRLGVAMAMAFLLYCLLAGRIEKGNGAEWSGIRAYVKHPQEAWSGSSDCAPCNRFCTDLRTRNAEIRTLGGNGWPTGYSEAGKAVVILRSMDGEPAPYFVPVVNGLEQADKKIVGYKGDLDAVLRLWPGQTTTVRGVIPAAEKVEVQRTFVDEEPQARIQTRVIREVVRVPVYQAAPRVTVQANAYTPHWTWPGIISSGDRIGSLREHLALTHGYSLAWLNTLSADQLEALHDNDHDSGRVTPYGVQRWPVQTAAVIRSPPTLQRYRASGINIGGFQMGSYSYRSNCPGGVCP